MKRGCTPDIITLILLGLMPLGWLVWRGFHADLGVNPIETVVRQLGLWGLQGLILGLMITPLSRLLNRPRMIRWRRPVGLLAAFYVSLHLLSYVGIDLGFDWQALFKDILKRPFITLGMIGFLLLLPLIFTSFNAAIKALGAARWRLLHRLIYVIVPLGVVHFFLMIKAGKVEAIIYGLITLLLLLARIWPIKSHN